jgi:hypothetical protein
VRSFFEQVPSKRTPLQVRHEAALKLLARGELDPYEALCLVCWPPRGSRLEHAPTERQFYADDLREEIRARHAAGESVPELALKTGIPFGQVKFICSTEGGAKREPAGNPGYHLEPAELTLF